MAPLDPDPDSDERKRRSNEVRRGQRFPLAGLALALVLVNVAVASLIVAAVKVLDLDEHPEVSTAVVVIVGVIGLLSALAVLVATFDRFGLASRGNALGLPDGSVQAVIALALILIFAIVGVYLHATTEADQREQVCLSRAQLEGLGDTLVEFTSQRVRRPAPPCARPVKLPTVTARPAPSGARPAVRRRAQRAIQRQRRALAQARRRSVVRYDATVAVPNPERENITTQLLTTVATLVVAVAGFYFGAKAVTAGAGVVRGTGGAGRRVVTGGREPPGGDEAVYGEVSPITDGPSPEDVRAEIESGPLAEEDLAEESLEEQRDAEGQRADQEEVLDDEAAALDEEGDALDEEGDAIEEEGRAATGDEEEPPTTERRI